MNLFYVKSWARYSNRILLALISLNPSQVSDFLKHQCTSWWKPRGAWWFCSSVWMPSTADGEAQFY